MNRLLILIAFLVLVSCTFEETAPSDTFVKFYGGNAEFELNDMILTSDNAGIVMFGTRRGVKILDNGNVIDSVMTGFILLRTDLSGKELARKEYRFAYDVQASRIQTIDGGYMFVGTQLPSGLLSNPRAIYGRVNESFNDPTFGVVESPTSAYYGIDINEFSDGGLFVAGYTDENGTNDFFYRKVGGINPWSRIQTRFSSDDRLVRAMPIDNDSFVLIGRTDTPAENGDGGVNVERTIINDEGLIVNSLVYGSSEIGLSDQIPSDVIEKPGGYAIAGSTYVGSTVKPFLMLVDLTGASSSTLTYSSDLEDFSMEGVSLTQTRFNDYFMVGTVMDYTSKEEGDKENDVMVMRTDQSGVFQGAWENHGLINGNEKGVRVLTAPDGSIYVGATYDFGGGLPQFALLKMNAEGELKK